MSRSPFEAFPFRTRSKPGSKPIETGFETEDRDDGERAANVHFAMAMAMVAREESERRSARLAPNAVIGAREKEEKTHVPCALPLPHLAHASKRTKACRCDEHHGADEAVHKRMLRALLGEGGRKEAMEWKAEDVIELCGRVQRIFENEDSCLRLQAPVKVFGDIHGQYHDLLRLFELFGSPSRYCNNGDICAFDYLFLGDYVDRGEQSLETICLLMALKIESPEHIHLVRGNHESPSVNCMNGLMAECSDKIGGEGGLEVWDALNEAFEWMPLGATIGDRILCVHGGIGQTVHSVQDIMDVKRPCMVDLSSPEPSVAKDLLWSDPTPHDSIKGIGRSRRGPGVCTFGPDRVIEFCEANKLDMIIRAHECVMDGFERFADGKLITVFSAASYCGRVPNAGAILVISRDLEVIPKVSRPTGWTGYVPQEKVAHTTCAHTEMEGTKGTVETYSIYKESTSQTVVEETCL